MMKAVVKDYVEMFQVLNHLFENKQKETNSLFIVPITKEQVYDIYMKHIPKEPFRTRPEWDCNTCKYTLYRIAQVVEIDDNFQVKPILASFMDKYEIPQDAPFFKAIFQEIIHTVTSMEIEKPFASNESKWGTVRNLQEDENGNQYIFNHFHFHIHDKFVNRNVTQYNSIKQSTQATVEKYHEHTYILQDVLEYIQEGHIYRGAEKVKLIEATIDMLNKYNETQPDIEIFAWKQAIQKPVSFNSDVIATLVEDLVQGEDPTTAINKYNQKVSPQNYRQVKSEIITKKQVDLALQELKNLGFDNITSAFEYATVQDLSIKHVLWTNRVKHKKDDLTSLLTDNIVSKAPKQVTEINLQEFMEKLKSTSQVEVDKNCLQKMTLIKANFDAPFFKWNNNIGFCYQGGLADVDFVTKQVEKHGGNVDAAFRISLYWENLDDLDLHLLGEQAHIYYNRKHSSRTNFELDIDMNVNDPVRGAIENIFASQLSDKDNGTWTVYVHNYTKRQSPAQVIVSLYENNKLIRQYEFKNPPACNDQNVCVLTIENGQVVKIHDYIPGKGISTTENASFIEVSDVVLSPNYWDDATQQGNKHIFFIVPDIQVENVKPYNIEQIHNKLVPHRKVLSVLAKKIQIQGKQNASGYGISFSKPREILVKLDGRPYKVKINPVETSTISSQVENETQVNVG